MEEGEVGDGDGVIRDRETSLDMPLPLTPGGGEANELEEDMEAAELTRDLSGVPASIDSRLAGEPCPGDSDSALSCLEGGRSATLLGLGLFQFRSR